VKFHDGRTVSSGDVKFTYQAIMDPKSLSPRILRLRAREVRGGRRTAHRGDHLQAALFPRFGTWGMGILPEHLLNDEALRKEASLSGKTRRSSP